MTEFYHNRDIYVHICPYLSFVFELLSFAVRLIAHYLTKGDFNFQL